MTQDYAVQNNGSSAVGWGTVGAGLGAAGGAAAAKWGNFGIPTQAYKTWEDAVAAVNKDDKFIKKQIEKAGDNAANWTKLKDNADELTKIKDEILKAFPENHRNNADVSQYIDDLARYNDALDIETTKILDDLVNGKTIEGLDLNTSTAEDIENYVKNNIDNVKSKKALLDASEQKVRGLAGVDDNVIKNVDVDKLITQRNKTMTNFTDDVLKTLKKPSVKWTALAGAAIAATLALIAKPKNKEV